MPQNNNPQIESIQESVWDYPRPPKLEKCNHHIQVKLNGITLANTTTSYRILETSHPPVYYLPPVDIKMDYLELNKRQTYCEWKGIASYYNIRMGDRLVENACWYYAYPFDTYKPIKDHIAFYANKVTECTVDGEVVVPQEGDFYGGWITAKIKGGFKGSAGTSSSQIDRCL